MVFSYTDDGTVPVLSGINMEIAENSFCALVGPSGGGKTTIARLIARFWDVNSGTINIQAERILGKFLYRSLPT